MPRGPEPYHLHPSYREVRLVGCRRYDCPTCMHPHILAAVGRAMSEPPAPEPTTRNLVKPRGLAPQVVLKKRG